MNRVNRKSQKAVSAPKKAAPKKAVQKKTKKVQKKVKATPQRTFRTTVPAKSHLYSHLAEFNPTKEAVVEGILAPVQEANAEELEKELLKLNATQYHIKGLDPSTDIDRRTTFTIFKPCKNSMQNEKNDRQAWRIREDRGRGDAVNQLSGDDYFGHDQGIYPAFPSQEDAIKYCVANNFKYQIAAEPMRRYDLRSYADNFKWKGPPKVDDI